MNAGLEEFQGFFERNYLKVVFFFVRAGLAEDQARDLAQEAFLRAHRGWANYAGEAGESAWLLQIARVVYKNYLQDRKTIENYAWPESIAQLWSTSPPAEEPSSLLATFEEDSLQEEYLRDEELRRALKATLADLPTKLRLCLKLRLRGASYSEIAEILDISIQTARAYDIEAREVVRQALRTAE